MANLILLFVCLLLGAVLKKFRMFPENGHIALNAFVINISLSALSLYYIPKINLNLQVLYPVAVPWLNIFLAFIFFSLLAKKMKWPKTLTGALIMGAGFGNTSFVGIPVIQALYGENGLKTVMLVDQPGSFVALSVLGITAASFYSGERVSARQIFIKIFKFPPFIAFLLAVVMNISNIALPALADDVLAKLGATTVPLALVSVGSQLRWQRLGSDAVPLFWGLLFKLIIFPSVIFILYFLILNQRGEMVEISFFEAAMGPMVTAAIIASAHNLQPRLCNLMLGVGIPVSFLTLALWYYVLHWSGIMV